MKLDGVVPTAVLLVVVCLLTFIAGGIIGGLIGLLKAKYNANEFFGEYDVHLCGAGIYELSAADIF